MSKITHYEGKTEKNNKSKCTKMHPHIYRSFQNFKRVAFFQFHDMFREKKGKKTC